MEAAKTLKETSALPAVCGRVCPQEKQCESKCIHLKMSKEAVAIGYLERFAADYERESGNISVPEIAEKNGIKIAVVGSGPAGLSFAGDMAKRGYDVTVFEALHEIGGVLKYGIPEFRYRIRSWTWRLMAFGRWAYSLRKIVSWARRSVMMICYADGF